MINDREYLCASSFLFASDGSGTPGERLQRYKECANADSLRNTVKDIFRLNAKDDLNIYSLAISNAVEKIKEMVPDIKVFYPLLYKYDCTNIKTAIKCKIRGIDPQGMLFSCGTLPLEKVVEMANNSKFEGAPEAMIAAANKAIMTYAETGEVRAIDLLLDKACFEDMQRDAKQGEIPLMKDIVSLRADGVNLLSALRIAQTGMPESSAKALFKRAFVPGGTLKEDCFILQKGGIADNEAILAGSRTSKSFPYVKAALEAKSFSHAERIFDEAVLSLCNEFRYKPFGPEIAVRFLLIREAEMTNCRILEAAMSSKEALETVSERLRISYV